MQSAHASCSTITNFYGCSARYSPLSQNVCLATDQVVPQQRQLDDAISIVLPLFPKVSDRLEVVLSSDIAERVARALPQPRIVLRDYLFTLSNALRDPVLQLLRRNGDLQP